MKIPLGTRVKDRLTGLVGVAENRASFLYGCDRYCVQPLAKEDGTIPESSMIDEPQLEILDPTPVMEALPEPVQLIELGQWVEDPVHGMSGTATGRAVYLNGCSRILVEPKQSGDFPKKAWWAPEPQLVQKTEADGTKKATVPAESTAPSRAYGGPAPSSSKY